MTEFEGEPESPNPDINLESEYWRKYVELKKQHEAEANELRNRHFRETVRLHLDYQDTPGAISYIEGIIKHPRGAQMIDDVLKEREQDASAS